MPRLLAHLSPGEFGRIKQIVGESTIRHQLLEMGMTIGTLVRMVRVAPLGDPFELHVRGYRLSVRKSEAAMVTVEGD